MLLSKEKIHQGSLVLVNINHPLRINREDSLISVNRRCPDILMKREAANILQVVLEKINAGSRIIPVSGYRSQKEQADIYRNSVSENGEEFTKKFVALPNHSEHQTGLAIDLGLNKEEIDFICPDFPYEGICNEFRNEAPCYGFIQRYEKEKEKITGISHEPWHFRYVGYPHSKLMEENGLSLEEYTDFVKEYSERRRLIYKSNGAVNEIYYVPAESENTLVSLPESCIYQISGNNVDGFVITVWRKDNG